jgi:hypothetical protein
MKFDDILKWELLAVKRALGLRRTHNHVLSVRDAYVAEQGGEEKAE